MLKQTVRNRNIFFIILMALVLVFILGFSNNKLRVEQVYTHGIYPPFAISLRFMFGWIPFSVGDLVYAALIIWLLWGIFHNIKALFLHRFYWWKFWRNARSVLKVVLCILIVFYIVWGLNYKRLGIRYELGLQHQAFDTSDLYRLQDAIVARVNVSKMALMHSGDTVVDKYDIFDRAVVCYHEAEEKFPFLRYRMPSIKPSLFSYLENYWGFTGYYNPFTGEAQVNTTVPAFLIPNITTHEMAHQIGYAKENEANFAGYLAAAYSSDTLFHYSIYLDLFMYANGQVAYFDSARAAAYIDQLIPAVLADLAEWRAFSRKYESFVDPIVSWIYGNYLRLNNQPKGIRSYGEVIDMLIAYYKKYGEI